MFQPFFFLHKNEGHNSCNILTTTMKIKIPVQINQCILFLFNAFSFCLGYFSKKFYFIIFFFFVIRVLSEIFRVFVPEVIVCQCGADGIAGDPMNSFNLTPRGLAACVRYLNTFNLPLLLLGGGKSKFF